MEKRNRLVELMTEDRGFDGLKKWMVRVGPALALLYGPGSYNEQFNGLLNPEENITESYRSENYSNIEYALEEKDDR